MTLLGKVFTGMIFVLSVVFFLLAALVNNEHINQKQEADKFRQQAQQAQSELTQARQETEDTRTELAIERAARRSTLAAMQEQLTAANSEKEASARAELNLQATVTSVTNTNKATATELKARTDENKQLRTELVDARQDRDQLFQRLVAATDKLSRLQGEYASLALREKDLADDYTKAKELLESLGVGPDTMLNAPATNGEVIAVNTSGIVEVSLGRDDGLRGGHTLEVHRNGQYLGRLVVQTVRDDKSTAKILRSYQRGYIRVGDRVDTQLEFSITRKN